MISLAFAILVLAAPDPAPAAAAPAAAAKTSEKPKGNEMVCKREAVLGSRMKQRTCMTQADWDARKADARDEIEKTQTNIPMR